MGIIFLNCIYYNPLMTRNISNNLKKHRYFKQVLIQYVIGLILLPPTLLIFGYKLYGYWHELSIENITTFALFLIIFIGLCIALIAILRATYLLLCDLSEELLPVRLTVKELITSKSRYSEDYSLEFVELVGWYNCEKDAVGASKLKKGSQYDFVVAKRCRIVFGV